jgi:uncharacterized protein
MRYEWDEAKNRSNIAKHGIPFDYATRVFSDPYRLDNEDTRRDYREQRRLTLGRIEWKVFAVAYTMRGPITRLISARKANPREQRRYYEALPT